MNNLNYIEMFLVLDIEFEILFLSILVNFVGYLLLMEIWVENFNKKCFYGIKWSLEWNGLDNFCLERLLKFVKKDSIEK